MFNLRPPRLARAAALATVFAAGGCGQPDGALPPVPPPEQTPPAAVRREGPGPATGVTLRTFGAELILTAESSRPDGTTTWRADVTFSPGLTVNHGCILRVHIYDPKSGQFVTVAEKPLPSGPLSSVGFTFDATQPLPHLYAYGIPREDGSLDLKVASEEGR
jgi:hypothetical protein